MRSQGSGTHSSSHQRLAAAALSIAISTAMVLLASCSASSRGTGEAGSPEDAQACMQNQMKMDGATQNYYLEYNTLENPDYGDLIGANAYLRSTPVCPTTDEPIAIPTASEWSKCPSGIAEHTRELR